MIRQRGTQQNILLWLGISKEKSFLIFVGFQQWVLWLFWFSFYFTEPFNSKTGRNYIRTVRIKNWSEFFWYPREQEGILTNSNYIESILSTSILMLWELTDVGNYFMQEKLEHYSLEERYFGWIGQSDQLNILPITISWLMFNRYLYYLWHAHIS